MNSLDYNDFTNKFRNYCPNCTIGTEKIAWKAYSGGTDIWNFFVHNFIHHCLIDEFDFNEDKDEMIDKLLSIDEDEFEEDKPDNNNSEQKLELIKKIIVSNSNELVKIRNELTKESITYHEFENQCSKIVDVHKDVINKKSNLPNAFEAYKMGPLFWNNYLREKCIESQISQSEFTKQYNKFLGKDENEQDECDASNAWIAYIKGPLVWNKFIMKVNNTLVKDSITTFNECPDKLTYQNLFFRFQKDLVITPEEHQEIADIIHENLMDYALREVATFWCHMYNYHYSNSSKTSPKYSINIVY